MLGHKERNQLELFITGSLRQLIPDDYVLVRVDRVLDLSWLRGEVGDCYCCDDGRPGIDPEVAVRLMLAGLLTGIVHDRRLMREAHVNIAIRWFAGYALHEKLPDHSSLTRIRQLGRGAVPQNLQAHRRGLLKREDASAEVVHIDASLIRANVSWDSLVERPYKQHIAVDDKVGVILDVEVTTGQTNEGEMIEPQVDEVKATTGITIKTVTADAGYSYAKVYGALERRGIEALIPAKAEPIRSRVPLRRFRYDAKHDL